MNLKTVVLRLVGLNKTKNMPDLPPSVTQDERKDLVQCQSSLQSKCAYKSSNRIIREFQQLPVYDAKTGELIEIRQV